MLFRSLTYTATVEDIKPDGAICHGTAHVGSTLLGTVELVFAHLDNQRFRGIDLFNPAEFLGMLRVLGLYRVGRNADGCPLEIPPHLLDAEAAASSLG